MGGCRRSFYTGRLILAAGLIFLALTLWPSAAVQAATIIYYDDPARDGLNIRAANYLYGLSSHFDKEISMADIADYRAGDMLLADYVIYLGWSSADIPTAFLEDVGVQARPVLWIMENIDQLTSHFGEQNPFGFEAVDINVAFDADRIIYQDQPLRRDPNNGFYEVQVTGQVTIFSELSSKKEPETKYPHYLCGGSLCYFADYPLAFRGEGDRGLVFADLLHEFYGTDQPVVKKAMVRLEDLAPGVCDKAKLVRLADLFQGLDIPFSLGVIPIFKDPQGIYHKPDTEIHLADDPDFVETINYLIDRGGTLIMHGVTHQHDRGITREDWEFTDENGAPLPDDSEEWVRERIEYGLAEFAAQDLYPKVWETPHYSASHGDYHIIAEYFDYFYEQPRHFPIRPDAPPVFGEDLSATPTLLPFFTPGSAFGVAYFPENLGYVDTHAPDTTPEKILKAALRLGIIRDGVPSFFFHHDMITEKEVLVIIDGLLEQGYTFVSPADYLGDDDDDDSDADDDDDNDDDDDGGKCGV